MQNINSDLKIFLFTSNQENPLFLESYLKQTRRHRYQIISFAQLSQLQKLEYLLSPYTLILLSGLPRDSDLDVLRQISQANSRQFPILLIADALRKKSQEWLMEVDWYLDQEQLSVPLLEKTLEKIWRDCQTQCELELIRAENIQLSSQLQNTKELFQAIVDNSSTMVWMCDAKGNSTFFNQAWNRIIGKKILAQKRDWMLNIHPQDRKYCLRQFEQALVNQNGFTLNYRLQTYQGNYRWISNYAVPQFTVNNSFTGFVGYCFDITIHKQTEQKLIQNAASDRLIAQITQKIHTSLELIQILQTTVKEVNLFLQGEKIQILQANSNGIFSLLFESRLHEQESYCDLACDVAEAKHVPQEFVNRNIRNLNLGESVTDMPSSGKESTYSTLLVPIRFGQELWGVISVEQCAIAREWTKEEVSLLERVALELGVAINQARLYQRLEEANCELEKLARVDSLTEIANRRSFDKYIVQEWTRQAREQTPLSLILCDIDYFKHYNDTYGHQEGDHCLRRVAQTLSKVAKRPADLVARYGGEEFVLVLPNTPLAGAKHLAQELKRRVESLQIPHISSPIDLYLTLSMGVACCIPGPHTDFQVLIAAADQGLYLAKERGRNQAVEYEVKF